MTSQGRASRRNEGEEGSPKREDLAPDLYEERALWQSWRTDRNETSRRALLDKHLPYARVVAAMLYAQRGSSRIEFEDYLQFARIGLLEAFDRYDPEGGAQFRTFASKRIRGSILDGVERFSDYQQQMAVRKRLVADRASSLTGDPEIFETKSNPSGEKVPDVFRRLADVGIGLAIGVMLEGTGMFQGGEPPVVQASGYQAAELRQAINQLSRLLEKIENTNERLVLRLHYQQGFAFEAIAREMGLTKGRVSQIHKSAIKSIRMAWALQRPCDRAF